MTASSCACSSPDRETCRFVTQCFAVVGPELDRHESDGDPEQQHDHQDLDERETAGQGPPAGPRGRRRHHPRAQDAD